MSRSHQVSARSFLIAGMSAAVVGAAVITPANMPAASQAKITAAAVQLTSLSSGFEGLVNGVEGIFNNLSEFGSGVQTTIDGIQATVAHVLSIPDGAQAAIKNSYDNAEGWSAYAAAMATFSLGLIPGLWWGARGIPLAYNTAEPLLRAGVYSFADIVGLDPVQFARDISAGISTSSANAAIYAKAWADSLVAVPTLPDYPTPPSALAAGLPAASAAPVAAAQAAAVTSGIENAIKNTYNAVEPWVAWGFELAQWGLGFVPGLWWVAPGISLAYFSIEPLVQAGVYTVADVLGLNFAQIGPDIQQGVQQSVQNFVNYGLAWLQSLIPFPPLPPFPPRPGAAVAAPSAARAAASVTETPAITPAIETAPDMTPAIQSSPAGDGASGVAEKTDAPAAEDTAPAPEAVAADTGIATPPVQIDAPAPGDAPASGEAPASSEAPAPSRGGTRGHRAPAAQNDDAGAGASAKAERAGASSR